MNQASMQRHPNSVAKTMFTVLLALLIPSLVQLHFLGWGVLWQLLLSIIFAYGFEIISLKLRRRPLKPFLTDGSAMVTAVLFALCISPLAPWYISLIGMLFAIVVGKHLYGGLGNNIFNPAMLGFAAVIVAFPQAMSLWSNSLLSQLSAYQSLTVILFGMEQSTLDAITAATPLSALQTGLKQGLELSQITQQSTFIAGTADWRWLAGSAAVGGLILLYQKIITWHQPLAFLLSVIVVATCFHAYDSTAFIAAQQQLFIGGIGLAAFFIVTDPTSGCSSNLGRLIFAIGAGGLTVLIRNLGAFPDGIAFAVLLMNMAAPLLDRLTIPKPYGHKK